MGRRVILRPLTPSDFRAWQEVRRHNQAWLTPWEPAPIPGSPDPVEDGYAFSARCHARAQDQRLGVGFGFGLFAEGVFAGEVNISQVFRGALQSCAIGYWVDERHAGNGYVPEGVVLAFRYAFEELHLHRVEIGIVPRNDRSLRVPAKLGLRDEGLALRLVEINGVWEDHRRFAITAEEWLDRRDELLRQWVY